MKTRAMSGGLAIMWLGVLAMAAPAAAAQGDSARDGAPAGIRVDGPTVQDAQRLQRAERWEEAAAAWGAIAGREPENGQAVFNLGYCLHAAGRLDEALEVHLRAAGFEEYRGIALYNAGCAHALMGNAEAAIKALTASQAAGFSLQNAREDSDLDSLQGDPRFEALLARSQSAPGFVQRLQQVAMQARMLYIQYAPEVRQNLDAMRIGAEEHAQTLMERVMRDERLGPLAMRALRFVQGREAAGGAGAGPAQEGGAASAPVPSLRDAQRLQQARDWGAAASAYAAVLESEPENVAAVFGHAYCLHMGGDYGAAIEAHKRAATFPQVRGLALYNLGCAYALTAQADKAFEALKASHEAGFDMADLLKTDADLDSLREDPRFELLVIEVGGGL